MEIMVLGSGCGKCRSTIGTIERFALASGVEIEIVKVENPDEIHRYGVRSTPAVVIGGKVVHAGGLPSHDEVLGWLKPNPIAFLNQPTRHLLYRQRRLVARLAVKRKQVERMAGSLAKQLFTLPWLTVPPIGFTELSKLVSATAPADATHG